MPSNLFFTMKFLFPVNFPVYQCSACFSNVASRGQLASIEPPLNINFMAYFQGEDYKRK